MNKLVTQFEKEGKLLPPIDLNDFNEKIQGIQNKSNEFHHATEDLK